MLVWGRVGAGLSEKGGGGIGVWEMARMVSWMIGGAWCVKMVWFLRFVYVLVFTCIWDR